MSSEAPASAGVRFERERERQASSDYQPVATPPYAGGDGSDGPTTSAENVWGGEARVFARPKKWQRLFREYRVVEFAGTGVMYLVGKALGKWMELNDRAIPRIQMRLNATTTIWARDPAMDQEKMPEHGLGIPIVVNLLINYGLPKFRAVRVIPHDVRDFLLSLGQAVTLSTILVNFTKNATGRFRPCFFELCGWNYDVIWDGVTNLCSDAAGERDGRKSFPSGHSSFAWSTMLVLSLYLLGRSRLNCENRSETVVRGGVKILKLFLCLLPTLAASWVAITRSIDNRHHYSDIVAGSIVGAVAACLAYSYNYASIFCWESAGLPCEEAHERRKAKLQDAILYSPQHQTVRPRSVDESQKFYSNQSEHFISMSNRGGTSSVRSSISKVTGET